MAYNPYGRNPYGMHPGYNPYPGAGRGMGHPGYGPPPGMSSAPGMAPPPGVQQPASATQANRPSGLHPSFQAPPNLPNINFNAPVIRLGGTPGGSSSANGGGNSSPSTASPRIGMPPPTTPSSWREAPDTPLSAMGRGPPGVGLGTPGMGGIPMRPDFGSPFRHDRGGLGMDHQGGGGRGGLGASPAGAASGSGIRDTSQLTAPPTNDEKLRTIFVHRVPPSLSSGPALEQLLNLVGRLRRWDSETSHVSDNKGEVFGFAQYEDANSLSSAIDLLKNVKVPLKKQEPKEAAAANGAGKDDTDMKDSVEETGGKKEKNEKDEEDEENEKSEKNEKSEDENEDAKEGESKDKAEDDEDDRYKGIEATRLQIVVDPVSLEYIKAYKENQSEEAKAAEETRRVARKEALDAAIHNLFFPPASATAAEADGDVKMADVGAAAGDGMEVVNIPIAQEDELADIPAEMREVVASEIASFRERSNRRDMERLKREQELEEREERRNGEPSDRSRAGKSSAALARGADATKNVDFVNGNSSANGHGHGRRREFEREDSVDTEANDEDIYEREIRQKMADEEAQFKEAERKWMMRERQRAAALEREKDRDRSEVERTQRHHDEQLERDQSWDDEREASRKNSLYHRDRAAWLRKRGHDRAEEEAWDAADRRAEREQKRREAADMEAARGMADSFLEQQAEGMMERRVRKDEEEEDTPRKNGKDEDLASETAAAPQKVTISFGAAAQRAQAQRGGAMRRTVAEVEGLLDDEEQEASTKKRQLVPINFEPMAASASMTDEEINKAVRALAQEIPTERDGLWAWTVQWDSLDESVIRDKLRPFVEKKVVEYLGVQEQFLVEVVEEHLRKHGKPEALVEELQEALDEAAEDLVKKLWRMVIFFTESEKRGLPA